MADEGRRNLGAAGSERRRGPRRERSSTRSKSEGGRGQGGEAVGSCPSYGAVSGHRPLLGPPWTGGAARAVFPLGTFSERSGRMSEGRNGGRPSGPSRRFAPPASSRRSDRRSGLEARPRPGRAGALPWAAQRRAGYEARRQAGLDRLAGVRRRRGHLGLRLARTLSTQWGSWRR